MPAPRDSFVGRDADVADVRDLLRAHRLVTLVGPPGVGKTRLAVEAARRLAGGVAVRLVELAPASGGTVADRALAALDGRQVPGQDALATLGTEAREDPMLVVLDNCDHVLSDAAAVTEVLLGRWPGTAVLATSRQPLRLAGEFVRPVAPLPVPEPEAADADHVRDTGAVRLLLDRASASGAGFAVTEANADAVGRLCRSLDGLPLAIELLAGRLRAYAPEQLARRLERGLSVVEGAGSGDPGSSPLRGAIERSYAALAPAGRALFVSLAVFPSTFSLEAAEEICAGARGDVVDDLAALVDRSLVSVVPAGETRRYRLLETLRAYADEQLSAGDRDGLRRRHAAHFAALAEQAGPKLRGAGARTWLQRLRAEQDDLTAALEWSLDSDPVTALRLVGSLWQFWQDTDQRRSGIAWAERALAVPVDAPAESRLEAVLAAGTLVAPSDARRCAELIPAATDLAQRLDDPYWRARTQLISVTAAAYSADRTAEEQAAVDRAGAEAVAYFRATGDHWHAAETLQALSLMQPEREAIATLEEARGWYERVGDELRAANCAYLTASVLVRALDEPRRAAPLGQEALAIALRLDNEHEAAHARSILAEVALRDGDLPRAVEVAAECQDVFRRAADHRCVSAMALLLGTAAARRGDAVAARAHLHEALDVARLGAHGRTVPLARALLAALDQAGRQPAG
jgi:predicted ATPase